MKNNTEANFSLNHGLDPTQAVELLKEVSHQSPENEACSQNLVQDLDYSPLGIRIAGGYIHNTEMTFERYIRVLKRGAQEKLVENLGGVGLVSQVAPGKGPTTTLEMALQLSIQKVQESNPRLIKVLQYCGYLANEKIPLDLFTELCRVSGEDKLDVEDELITVMVGKENFSLLTYQSDSKTCYLHRTTQSVLRNLTSDPTKIIQEATSVIINLYPYDGDSDASIKRCSEVSDHMLALSQHAKPYPISAKMRISLLLTLGQVYHRFSRYEIGYRCLAESLRLVDGSTQPADPNEKVLILEVMASHKYDLEKYDEAIDLLSQALNLATDPVLIGGIYNNLAKNYRGVDPKHVLALKAYQDALKACDPVSPKSKRCHLTLADSHVGIGLCLESANDRERALSEYKQALEIYDSSLEGQNLCTAITCTNIGKLGLVSLDPDDDEIYKFENFGVSQEDSRAYLLKSLETKIEIYGRKTRSVAISYEWLGHIILVSGQWKEALDYFQRAIDIYEDLLEKGSNRELDSYNGKAMALEKSQDSKYLRLAVEIL